MKLLTLNVSVFDDNNEHLSDFLNKQNADIICLQEVTRPLVNSMEKRFISKDAIDEATSDLRYSFFGAQKILEDLEVSNFHGKEVFSFKFGGSLETGNYTKSRFKIVKAQNIFVENSFSYSSDTKNWQDEQSRSVVITEYEIESKKLKVFNYHGVWTKDKLGNNKSLAANKEILRLALKAKGEVIICGDFNLFPDTRSMKVFEKSFTSLVDKFNIKSTRPATNELSNSNRNVVDYILVSRGINIKNFEVIETDVSDHFPLALDFTF